MKRIVFALLAVMWGAGAPPADVSFTDVTAKANVAFANINGASPDKHLPETMGSGGAFVDLDSDGWVDIVVLDGDGDLDLFVTRYVDLSRSEPFCGDERAKRRAYCHPLALPPMSNLVFRNDGHGVFTDVSESTGIAKSRSNGLGVVISDLDGNGFPDVFVANDSLPNFLFVNDGGWRFTESALQAGVSVADDGKARAGMGVDTGDYDGDGLLDVIVTNLDFEM